MEQLAQRKLDHMTRLTSEVERDYGTTTSASASSANNNNNEDDEDDYDDDDYDDEDEMTEEQKMEEGRRMFQIFAARMFEQRVLTAYREKVRRLSLLCFS